MLRVCIVSHNILCICVFSAFRVLVRLLGISLLNDELPGSALVDDGSESSQRGEGEYKSKQTFEDVVRNVMRERKTLKLRESPKPRLLHELHLQLQAKKIVEQRARYERNCMRIRQVFNQLANQSCKHQKKPSSVIDPDTDTGWV